MLDLNFFINFTFIRNKILRRYNGSMSLFKKAKSLSYVLLSSKRRLFNKITFHNSLLNNTI